MIYKHCKRCRGTGFDPDIDMPGTCEHTSKAPLRSLYKPSMIAPNDRRIFQLPRAFISWHRDGLSKYWTMEHTPVSEDAWRRLKKS